MADRTPAQMTALTRTVTYIRESIKAIVMRVDKNHNDPDPSYQFTGRTFYEKRKK